MQTMQPTLVLSDLGGYRKDNPIRFDTKLACFLNRAQIEQRMQDFRYHAYDSHTKAMTFGPGASGSLSLMQTITLLVFITGGGYRTIGGVDDTFRNFTPIFVQSANFDNKISY